MKHLASKMAFSFCLPVREVLEEARSYFAVLLCEKWVDYDSSRSSPMTWIYTKVRYHLLTYCRKRKKEESRLSELEDTPASPHWIQEMWCELGQEGRSLLRIIFEAPGVLGEELWEWRSRYGRVRMRLKPQGYLRAHAKDCVLSYLRDEAQWDEEYIERAWRQLEEQCQR
jgi:hypothetical protein